VIEVMSLQQAQGITGGVLTGGNPVFSAVGTDTRLLQPQELFVALKGPNFNGNNFVQIAEQSGAAAALVSESVTARLPLLQVADTMLALGLLGKHNRCRSKAKVLALTGSQGKTTVKEMTAAILSCSGSVLSTKGNLNNDIGVPLTLLKIAAQHQFAVIEMGANAAGEIAYTAGLAQPDIAHITNVAATHLEGFGTLEGVAKAKAEIWPSIRNGGTAVLNLDDANIPAYFNYRENIRVVTISTNSNTKADYQLRDFVDLHLLGSSFSLISPQGTTMVNVVLPGRHNACNALAAAALAMEGGATLPQVVQGLGAMKSVKGRLNMLSGLNGAVILDDTYNASPASFRAAIDVLATLPGLRIVVAGDMGELGSEKNSAHTELGAYAKAKGIQLFFGTGELCALAVTAFGGGAVHKDNREELALAVYPLLTVDVHVLVKGSRSAGMEHVVKLLTQAQE